MLERLKHIPRVGEAARFGAAVLRVTRASDRAVEEIHLHLGKRRATPID
jgi:hypothetical protein